MRAIWRGSIAFGLVNVPVKVYSATDDHDVSLHQVHELDGGRIRYQRRCEICGEVIDYKDIAKAFDDGEQTVVLSDEDLASLPVEKSREIEVVEFVPSDQVDPILFDRTYYLEPASSSTKSYVLLRRTLEDADRTAVVQFSLRQKSRLGALRVRGKVLTLQTLLWEDEVREAVFPSLEETVRISAQELEMSSALVDSFSSDFNPAEFADDYQDQLKTLIEAKLEKGEALDTRETFGTEAKEEDGKVLDLMEALRRSVEKNRDRKTGSAGKTGKAGKARKAAEAKDKKPAAHKPAAKTRKGA